MNAIIFFIIGIPLIEIYLLIKVGSFIGAFNTIFLILFTAITGVYFAKLAGLSTMRSGINQLIKNEIPIKPKARFKIVIMFGILFFNLKMDYIFFHLLYL